MKKMNFENKIEISKRKAGLAVVTALSIMSMFVIAGCGKEKNTEPTTSSTTVTKEETTPMDEGTTEPTQEETVEPAETVLETEVVNEKEPETFDELVEYLNNSGFHGLKIIALFDDNKAKVIEDGENFTVENHDCAPVLYYSEKAEEIKASSSYFSFFELNDNCSMIIFGTEDCEGTITVTTVDGNVYEITNSYTIIDTQN